MVSTWLDSIKCLQIFFEMYVYWHTYMHTQSQISSVLELVVLNNPESNYKDEGLRVLCNW